MSIPLDTLADAQIAITGGAGFIGSTLADHLVDHCDVCVIDDFSSGFRTNVPGSATVLDQDITDLSSTDLEGVEYLFHLAANVSIPRSVEDPCFDARSNVTGLLSTLEAARKAGVERVVFSSSSAVYGDPSTLPVAESAPISPASPYAVAKHAGEQYATLYADLYDVETVSLRYFNVYGPGQRADSPHAGVVAIFIQRLLEDADLHVYGDGTQTRDFVHVSDVVAANVLAATTAEGEGRTYNVGTGSPTSIDELGSTLESVVGTEVGRRYESPRPGDVSHSYADIRRIEDDLGFEPAVSLRSGLERTVEWYERRRK